MKGDVIYQKWAGMLRSYREHRDALGTSGAAGYGEYWENYWAEKAKGGRKIGE